MINSPLKASVLTMKLISNLTEALAAELELPEDHKSIGMFTADTDDVAYTAMDEATKKANIKVVYGKSFYGGAANANSKLAGEVIGIISGPRPEDVRAGLGTIRDFVENGAWFLSANEDDSIPYYAHCISRCGTYLAEAAGCEPGTSIAYLIAPPEEAMFALDAAMKAADVQMGAFYGPPSETNFGGALLTGTQSACKAACGAFGAAVIQVANNPLGY